MSIYIYTIYMHIECIYLFFVQYKRNIKFHIIYIYMQKKNIGLQPKDVDMLLLTKLKEQRPIGFLFHYPD